MKFNLITFFLWIVLLFSLIFSIFGSDRMYATLFYISTFILGIIYLFYSNAITKSSATNRMKILSLISFAAFNISLLILALNLRAYPGPKAFLGLFLAEFMLTSFMLLFFVVGIVLYLKRKNSTEKTELPFDINKFLKITFILFILVIVLLNYNMGLSFLAKTTNTSGLCSGLISFGDSIGFNPDMNLYCLRDVSIHSNNAALCQSICDNANAKDKDNCKNNIEHSCIINIIRNNNNLVTVNNPEGDVNDFTLCMKANTDISKCNPILNEQQDRIQSILKDPNNSEIFYAINATTMLNRGTYIPLLQNLIKNGNLEVKRAAVKALMNYGYYGTFESMINLYKNDIYPYTKDQPGLEDYNKEMEIVIYSNWTTVNSTTSDVPTSPLPLH